MPPGPPCLCSSAVTPKLRSGAGHGASACASALACSLVLFLGYHGLSLWRTLAACCWLPALPCSCPFRALCCGGLLASCFSPSAALGHASACTHSSALNTHKARCAAGLGRAHAAVASDSGRPSCKSSPCSNHARDHSMPADAGMAIPARNFAGILDPSHKNAAGSDRI